MDLSLCAAVGVKARLTRAAKSMFHGRTEPARVTITFAVAMVPGSGTGFAST